MKKATLKNGLKIGLVAGLTVALVPTVYGQGIGLQTLERMLVPTPQALERGSEVYEDQCATCHGDEGRGGAELGQRFGAQGFVGVDVERSGLKSIFSVIAHGIEDAEHPTFENLFFQDQWAVAHYVHGLIDDPQPDPPEVVERIRNEFEFGICDPEIRASIADFLEPEDAAQIELGQQQYQILCVACHGADGRSDTPAGQAVGARDFHDDPADWARGTSQLALFNTLQQGVEPAMPAFANQPDEVLWALVHYMRQDLIPDENLESVTEEQVEEACRALSTPAPPPSIPVQRAMEFLAQDVDEQRFLQLHAYGDVQVAIDADPSRGSEVFAQSCASCHGDDGVDSRRMGPFGAFPPYLHVEPRPLVPASVGGTYLDVAQRVLGGPHASIPTMVSVIRLTESDWKDLQAYVAQFDGMGRDTVRVVDPDALPAEEEEDLEGIEDGEGLEDGEGIEDGEGVDEDVDNGEEVEVQEPADEADTPVEETTDSPDEEE